VNTPLLGVIENMSGFFIEGNVENGKNLSIEGQPVDLGDDGNFVIRIDLFKKGGGKSESDRLNIPLLAEIPISQDIMEATDSGKPLSEYNNDSHIAKIYNNIAEQLLNNLH